MTLPVLGLEMQVALLAIEGELTSAGAVRLLKLVIERIKMRTGGLKPQAWTYPLPGTEDGGIGETTAQPILVTQPLLESLSCVIPGGVVVTDSWVEHGGFYLMVASCRPFGVGSLARWLGKRGWKIVEYGQVHVAMRRRKKSWLRRLLER